MSVLLCIGACASTGDPPGGPPDVTPPNVVAFEPDSGAVLTAPPQEASIIFDEVVSERTAGQPADISGAVILSPTSELVRTSWKRDRITVRPKSGFQAGRIYHVELLPVITDLRTNRMRAGRTIVFSTGPPIPTSRLEGTVVDWVGGRPAPRALVEAVLMPDSLVYRSLSDSGGVFRISQLPPGHYRVYGVIDANNDRRRGAREVYDSAGVDIDSAGPPLELFAFARDTTGPRLRQGDIVDSITLKLTFDRPLDPTLVLDTTMVTVAPQADTTSALPLVGIYTQKGLDSARTRADSVRRAAPDTALGDSIPKVPVDTARKTPPDTTRRAAPRAPRRAPPLQAPRDTTNRAGRPPLDSTRADRMLARRPAPSEVRMVRLAVPLTPDTRYVIFVRGARSLSGNPNDSRTQVRTPRAPAAGRTGGQAVRDSVAPDSTTVPQAADTTRPAQPRRP